MPAWCVGYLWTRVGWGEAQQLMRALRPVRFTIKGIFFCPSTPSPTVGWEGGRGTGGDDEWPADAAEARVCLALPSSPPPGHLLPVRTLSPPYFCFRGGHEEIKRSSGRERHRDKPQSLARPNFKRQLPPTLHCPALHPTCSDTHGCFSLGTTINNSRCPRSGMAGVQTELSVIFGGFIPYPPGLPITGP